MSDVLTLVLVVIGVIFNRLAEKVAVENREELAFRSPHDLAIEIKKEIPLIKIAFKIQTACLLCFALLAILT